MKRALTKKLSEPRRALFQRIVDAGGKLHWREMSVPTSRLATMCMRDRLVEWNVGNLVLTDRGRDALRHGSF